MADINSMVTFYRCNINHNGLFGCDFVGGSRDGYFDSPDGGLASFVCSMGVASGAPKCTFLRKDNAIMVDKDADWLNANGVNYCRFKNPSYNGRWTYCFIDKIEYVAPETSKVYIRTDVFTTYYDIVNLNQCFIEREHVSNDTPYSNTVPEPIGSSELNRLHSVRLLGDSISNDDANWLVAFNISQDLTADLGGYLGVVSVGGIPSGTYWYGVTPANAIRFTNWLIDHSAGESILSISLISIYSSWINDGTTVNMDGEDVFVYHLRDTGSAESGYAGAFTINIGAGGAPSVSGGAGQVNSVDVVVDGYINGIRSELNNMKVLNYPYMAFELFTYDGSSVTLVPQDTIYNDGYGSYFYKIRDTLVQGTTPSETAIVAAASRGSDEDRPYTTVSFSGFPQMSVAVDAYASFLARNANSLKFQKDVAVRDMNWKMFSAAKDGVGSMIGMFTGGQTAGNAMNSAGGMLSAYKNFISAGDQVDAINAKMLDAKNAPDGVAGHASDGALFELNRLGIWFAVKRINWAMLVTIDNYFDRYGYQVNRIGTPQWNSRDRWNYVKTGGANVGGAIPAHDKETFNQLLDSGLTVFHSPSLYGQYDGAQNRASIR